MQNTKKALSLFFLLLISYTLHAAKSINLSDVPLFLDVPQTEVFDHTATHVNKKVDHAVDFQDLDDENLKDDVDTLSFKAKNNPVLLVVILSNQAPHNKANNLEPKDDEKQIEQEGQGYVMPTPMGIAEVGAKGTYKKYVLDANGLLHKKVHNSAQKLGYHIIQTEPAHIVVALMQWIKKSSEKHIYDIAINVPVCSKCQYLLTLMGCTIHVNTHAQGCQAMPFPWPMPSLAMGCLDGVIINSGKPLQITQTLLQRVLGISETSYNALKYDLNKTKLKLNDLRIDLSSKEKRLNENLLKLEKKDDEIKQLKNKFKLEFNKKQKEIEKLKKSIQYKGKVLPQDLSNQNLSGYDFTGCRFTYTKLAYTDLTNVILTNTTCDYQKAFLDNIKKNKIEGDDFYRNNLPKDLKSIAVVYPKLNNHKHKAKLLQIASAFSQLPFYEKTEFYIKVEYWSAELLQLKQALGLGFFGYGYGYGNQLVCSLQSDLEWDANNHCWTTSYPQDKVNMDGKAPHANFVQYLKDFKGGLTKYQCKSKNKYWGFDWYKDNIVKNIEGLASTYPYIKEKSLKQEACDIAYGLSKAYQLGKGVFQHHYLFLQHRLIRLKKSIGVEMKKNKVHYSLVFLPVGSSRGGSAGNTLDAEYNFFSFSLY